MQEHKAKASPTHKIQLGRKHFAPSRWGLVVGFFGCACLRRRRRVMGTVAVGNELEEEEEPILKKQKQRFCMFPIRYMQSWEMYKKAERKRLILSLDVQHWEKLHDSDKHFIGHVLAFFATSDGMVLENLSARFLNDVQVPVVPAFYGFQIAMENVHSEMYSLLLETYTKDSRQKDHLFNAIETVEGVAKKAKWAFN